MSESQPARSVWEDGPHMTYDLIRRHPEIFKDTASPQNILYVMDIANKPMSKGRPVMARLSKISGRVVDFIDAGGKDYMLEWFQFNTGHLSLNQSYLLLAQQLMLFESDGDGGQRIGGWDIQEQEIIADRFGFGWFSATKGDVADIMDEAFLWGRAGQSRINFAKMQEEEQRRRAEANAEAAAARQAEKAEQTKASFSRTPGALPN